MQHGTKAQNPASHQEAGERRNLPCEVWLQRTARATATCTVVAARWRSTPKGVGIGVSGAPPVRSPWRSCHVWHRRTDVSVALLTAQYLTQFWLPSPLETPCHRQYSITLEQLVAKEITAFSRYPSLLMPILSITLIISLTRPSVVPFSRVSCPRLDFKPKGFSAVVATDEH